jgi:hypothetical protein
MELSLPDGHVMELSLSLSVRSVACGWVNKVNRRRRGIGRKNGK